MTFASILFKVIEKQFGKILRKKRLSKGLSQNRLALKSDLDRTYISLLERGLRMPTIETLFKIARALEESPSKIVCQLHRACENNNK